MVFDTQGGLRVAGQHQDLPSHSHSTFPHIAELDEGFLGAGPSPTRSMYGDSTTLEAWIKTVCQAAQVEVEAGPATFTKRNDIYSSELHPYNHYYSPAEDYDSEDSSIAAIFRDSPWVPAPPSTILEDSDDSTTSESSASDSDFGESEAQYISIPSDSPWYRPASPSPDLRSDSPCDAFFSGTFPMSCSSDVRQAIAQQELLLDIFHKELRRIVPRDYDDDASWYGGHYDTDWLEDVDPEVVLAPMESFEDLCWDSVVGEDSGWEKAMEVTRRLDVPVGCGDGSSAF
ncbi:hypothetical protein BV22DRAFT_1049933 [Leucogyrophana mollusca]|uniref:Uncharacterized protein n=1 Tax=Leucogyrophana mollusca TaxID=85980 RepID=A0ACB8B5U1_9AGAM|nr:hypothetical protein BV22DRAFT_1049933 [Leucogyrophana mollusca]